MATPERIADLEAYCKQWEDSLANVTERRDQLLSWQSNGMHIFENDSEEDLLPTLIAEADSAARTFQKVLIRMQFLRDRAIAGEDV